LNNPTTTVDTADNTPYLPELDARGFFDYTTRFGNYFGQLVSWHAETYYAMQSTINNVVSVSVFPDGFTWGYTVVAATPRSVPTLTGSGNPNPVPLGRAASLTATLDMRAPNILNHALGVASFVDTTNNNLLLGYASVQDVPGEVQVLRATLPGVSFTRAGAHNIQITYSGSAFWFGASNSFVENVAQANVSVDMIAPQASVIGQPINLSATVAVVAPGAGTPTGTVTFYADGSIVGSALLDGSGSANINLSSLSVGTHNITATYAGDANFLSGSGSTNEMVNPGNTTTVVTASPTTVAYGQSVTLTATIGVDAPAAGPPPTGPVTFYADGVSIGAALVIGGQASLSASGLAVGSHTISAVYGGDINFNGSSAAIGLTVTATTPVVTLSNPGNQTNTVGDLVSLPVMAYVSNGDLPTYSAVGLPPGLTLSNGTISGTIASNAGSSTPYTVTITATDSLANVSASLSFTWTVNPPVGTVTLSNPGSQTNTAGDLVSLPVMAYVSNGDLPTYSATGLPVGLTISSGAISGTIASNAGSSTPYTVTITAIDPLTGASATQTFTWSVNPATETITFTNPGNQATAPGGTVLLPLMAYASNGDTLTFSATGLPPGLTISSNGGISGTIPSDAGNNTPYTVTITATDSITGFSASVSLIWTV
jgi:hypothetical protein